MSENSKTEHIINGLDPGRGFLGHLTPPDIPHYPYHSPGQFLQDYERELNSSETTDRWENTDRWFLLTGVTQRIFNEWFSSSESGPFSHGCAFDAALERLLVALPESTTHSVAAQAFTRMVDRAAEAVGMEDGLDEIGSGAHTSPEIGTKQPDMAWRPVGRNNKWPSMVLEVLLGGCLVKLQSDIRYWCMAPPEGVVNIILTLQISQGGEVVIEKWDNTRAQGGPRLEQTVVISRTGSTVMITGSPLTISFSKLFLRNPCTPEEGDLQLDDQKLQSMAEKIWDEQWLNTCEGNPPRQCL
ncbi:hypothetical protein BDV18DRAFT_138170 [Aspergillus unguis]